MAELTMNLNLDGDSERKEEENPDQLEGFVHGEYSGRKGEPFNEHMIALRLQLEGELERLEEMLHTSRGISDSKDNFAKKYLWIATTKDGERSEFSIRLARARALFEALIAMGKVGGIPQATTKHDGPWSLPINSTHGSEK